MSDDGAARGVVELLPCPFCGGPVEIARGKEAGAIQCVGTSSCLHTGLLIGFGLADEETAIAAWNRRATPTALAAAPEVAKLIRDAEARGMERAADDLDARAQGLSLEISALWSGSRAADRLKERRYECRLLRDAIRAAAAIIRGETK